MAAEPRDAIEAKVLADDAAKLRLVADWFDLKDRHAGIDVDEVQRDLRRIAGDLAERDRATPAAAEVMPRPNCRCGKPVGWDPVNQCGGQCGLPPATTNAAAAAARRLE